MDHSAALLKLTPGMPVIYGGDRVAFVSEDLAAAFAPGDRLLVVQTTGDLLRVPAAVHAGTQTAVGRAFDAFAGMAGVSDEAITHFFEEFALRLEDRDAWGEIAAANELDVAKAQSRGRSTTRLAATEKMRQGMIDGLRAWRDMPGLSGRVVERAEHEGWSAEQLSAPLGVVGFVFEGRPNVFADAAGVLRSGNTVVFRIGSDALGTARAIVRCALAPALKSAGIPEGAATLVESEERAAGWAMFSDSRIALAVARGSGRAVEQLGSVARQSGVPVSLHGTGGAWIVADGAADPRRLERAVFHSLDRKVCNTLNTICLPADRPELARAFLRGLTAAGERLGHGVKLHVVHGDERAVPAEWFTTLAQVRRAEGDVSETIAETLEMVDMGREWEWEQTPEVTVKLVKTTEEAVILFNRYSPQFVASLITDDLAAAERFYRSVNAPFVGDGFTRWVDGQYTLGRPELGLSNWQTGRLFARGAILSGDGVFTIRTRVRQRDPDIGR